jgi:hypothetical protein
VDKRPLLFLSQFISTPHFASHAFFVRLPVFTAVCLLSIFPLGFNFHAKRGPVNLAYKIPLQNLLAFTCPQLRCFKAADCRNCKIIIFALQSSICVQLSSPMARQIIPVSPQSQGLLDFAHPDVLGPMVSFLMLRKSNRCCPILLRSSGRMFLGLCLTWSSRLPLPLKIFCGLSPSSFNSSLPLIT